MKRFFIYVLGGIVAVVAIGLLYLSLGPLGPVKNYIEETVAQTLGRDFRIAGDMEIDLLPQIRVQANGIYLASIDEAEEAHLAKLGDADISLSTWPLLMGKVSNVSILLNDLDIALEVLQDGQVNWQFTSTQPEEPSKPLTSQEISNLMAQFERVEIQNSRLTYRQHGQEDQTITIKEAKVINGANKINLVLDGAHGELPLKGDVSVQNLAELLTDGQGSIALDVEYDQSDLSGDITLALAPKISVAGALASDQIVIPVPKAEEETSKEETTPVAEDATPKDTPLPLEMLEKFDADLQVAVGNLISGDHLVRDVDLHIINKEGKIIIDPLQFVWNGGLFSGELSADNRNENPLAFVMGIQDIDMGELSQLIGQEPAWQGKLGGVIDLNAKGQTLNTALSSLNGNMDFKMGEGQMGTYYLELVASDLILSMFSNDDLKISKVKCFDSRVAITDGLAKLNYFAFNTERVILTGGGEVDLPNQKLKLNFTPSPKNPSLLNLATKVNVGGTFDNPSLGPDAVGLLGSIAKIGASVAFAPAAAGALVLSNTGKSDEGLCGMDVTIDVPPKPEEETAPTEETK